MTIGEIVEILIRLRDDIQLDERTDEAVCAACNILDELPGTLTDQEIREILRVVNVRKY